MRVTLEKKWTEQLVNQLESGMGYQRVDIRFAGGRLVRDVLVFNAEEAELPEEFARLPITDIVVRRSCSERVRREAARAGFFTSFRMKRGRNP
jgi:hypothetical protein